MKQLLILITTISLLVSCNQKKVKTETKPKKELKVTETHNEPKPITELKSVKPQKKLDSIHNYWELDFDTITFRKDFKISCKNYFFELKKFSLNDSALVRNLSQPNDTIYVDHSHTIVSDFKISTDSFSDHKRITKADFKDSLYPEFYKECNLFSAEIDSINNNVIYLTSDLNVPDSDNQWRVWYSIVIKDNKIDSLKIEKTDYVGL